MVRKTRPVLKSNLPQKHNPPPPSPLPPPRPSSTHQQLSSSHQKPQSLLGSIAENVVQGATFGMGSAIGRKIVDGVVNSTISGSSPPQEKLSPHIADSTCAQLLKIVNEFQEDSDSKLQLLEIYHNKCGTHLIF